MRRFVQLLALVVMILTGSVPGLYLLGPSRPMACCAFMGHKPCPCRSSDRSPGPAAPCGPGLRVPAALLAAPAALAPAGSAHREPAPFPQIRPAGTIARLLAADPGLQARPGPAPPGLDRNPQAWLSLFRI